MMAMSAAERQRKRRERLKQEGAARRDGRLEREEQQMLQELCVARRPGKSPYSENEMLGLLIRQNHSLLKTQQADLRKTRCKKCGDTPPITSCPCAGDHECWVTIGYQVLAIKL